MRLQVKLFASVREAIGAREIQVELPADATVADLLSEIRAQHPQVGPGLEAGLVAVNQEYVGLGTRLQDGDEVAIIPPVSGGSEPVPGEGAERVQDCG